MKTLPISIPSDALADYCRRHRIARLALFGSVLRDDFGPDSDLDILIEFEPGHGVGLIRFAGMERELAALFARRVDLVTPDDLSRYFVQDVLREALPIQVAA